MEWRSKLYNNIKGSRLKTGNDVLHFILDEFEKLVKPLEEKLGTDDFYTKHISPYADLAELKIENRWLQINTGDSNIVKITTHYRIVKDNGEGEVYDGDKHEFYKKDGIFVDKKNSYITPATIDSIFKKAFYGEGFVSVFK